jgi:hypothetical protein
MNPLRRPPIIYIMPPGSWGLFYLSQEGQEIIEDVHEDVRPDAYLPTTVSCNGEDFLIFKNEFPPALFGSEPEIRGDLLWSLVQACGL